ncbi:hypothetical protein [Nocardia sp. NPDC005366]|uniref:hypothetical protein n=1 Tax=Nocardia sp. NPDC005366 TaxID=3156878 RepID=UPI0033A0AE2E
MSVLGATLLVSGSLTALVMGKVLVSLLSKEVEGRIDHAGYTILRLARRRLPADLRESLHDDEWLPEMDDILERHKDRPITRLVWPLRFSMPLLLWGAARTARIVRATPALSTRLKVYLRSSTAIVRVIKRIAGATPREGDAFGESIEKSSRARILQSAELSVGVDLPERPDLVLTDANGEEHHIFVKIPLAQTGSGRETALTLWAKHNDRSSP